MLLKYICILLLCIYLSQGAGFIDEQQLEIPPGGNKHGVFTKRVEILSVSTRIDQLNYEPVGSINGGTLIYLKAYGHSQVPHKNTIKVGPYDCDVEENGISGDLITCRTRRAHDVNRRYQLDVVLHVEGKIQSICLSESGNCTFTYSIDATPFQKSIEPSVATPNSFINWNSIWRVTDTEDITKLKIGEQNCNRFQLEASDDALNLNDSEEIKNFNSFSNLPCQLSSQIQSGFYTSSSEILWGNAYKLPSTQQLSANGSQQYEFAVTANIQSISSNSGGETGNRITINGKGFGNNKETVRAQVGEIQCDVKSINNNQIVCDLQSGQTLSSGQGQFIKGQGMLLSAWQLDETEELEERQFQYASQFRQAVQNQELESERLILNNVTRGNWDFQFQEEEYDRQGVWGRGYFKAPRTGNYKFWLSANDKAQLFLNTNPNDQTFSEDNLILESNKSNKYRQYYNSEDQQFRQEQGQTLQAGKYYWLEIFVLNNFGSGHFTVSVETPDINNEIQINSVDQIQEFAIVPSKNNQIWSIKMYGSQSEYSFNFKYQNPQTRNIDWDRTTYSQKWSDWKAEDIASSFTFNAGTNAIVSEEHRLDVNGKRCPNNSCTAGGVEFIVEFTEYRNESQNMSPNCQVNGGLCVVGKLQEQSGPVAGTFRLKYNNQDVKVWVGGYQGWVKDIPYDIGSESIKNGLIQLDEEFLNTEVYFDGTPQNGRRFIFNFKSNTIKQNHPLFTFDSTGLQGGRQGTSPQVIGRQVLSASKNPLYEPIPFDMSFQPANNSQINVFINDIPAVCSGNCQYETQQSQTPVLSSYTLNGLNLSLNLSQTTVSFNDSTLQVWFGGSECLNINTSNKAEVTCTLSGIESGDNQPTVLIQNIGFATYTGSQTEQIPQITSISPTSGSVQGGIQITVSGFGFPINDSTNTFVIFGSSEAQIISTSNTEIVVNLPQSNNGESIADVVVISNSKQSQDTIQFTYSANGIPIITSLDPISASPIKKSTILVHGSGFGNDPAQLEAWLVKDNVLTYQLNILDGNFSDTLLAARLGGGHVGNYELRIIKKNVGFSIANSQNANQFSYVINLDTVSPQTGNPNGGSIITLSGSNFSKNSFDNTVLLKRGDITLQASIISSSENRIVARLPPASPLSNGPYNVIVAGRLIETSTCNSDCTFTYGSNTNQPKISEDIQSLIFKNLETINIQGNHFNVQKGATVEVQGTSYDATVVSSTLITFQIPQNLAVGNYLFLVVNGDSGFAGGFEGQVTFTVDEVQPSEISTFGSELVITGSGFMQNTQVLVNNVDCPVIKYASTELTCIAPPLYYNGSYSLELRQPGLEPIILLGAARYREYMTPNIYVTDQVSQEEKLYDLSNSVKNYEPVKYLSKTLSANNPFTVTLLEYDDIIGTAEIEFYLQSTFDQRMIIKASSINGLSATFDNPIAGTYFLKVYVQGRGFAQLGSSVVWEYTFTMSTPSIVSGSTTTLVGNDILEIQGQGFDYINSYNNNIYVCGRQCITQSASKTGATCLLPPLKTDFVLNTEKPMQKQLNPLYSYGVNQVKKVTTHRNPTENVAHKWNYNDDSLLINLSSHKPSHIEDTDCWVQFEAYEGSLIEFQSVQWHSKLDHPSFRGSYSYTDTLYYEFTVEGSNTGNDGDWVELAVNKPYDKVNFREVQHQHANYGYGGFNRSQEVQLYKYIRARENAQEVRHNTCHYHSIHLFGYLRYQESTETAQDAQCNVEVQVFSQFASLTDKVTYEGQATPIVDSINPQYASIKGGEQLTIKGQNFGTDQSQIQVKIDGIDCIINSLANENTITCTTGNNSGSNDIQSKVEVIINGKQSIIAKTVYFHSGLLFSDDDTWNGELPPRRGDTIFVPKGQTLIIDESTDVYINSIIVEGTLVFADNKDLTLDAMYIIVRSGQFLIGSKELPYTHKLTITLHGSYWDKQLPEFGNKVLGCHTCNLQLHGTPKEPSWSSLKATISPGDTSLTIKNGDTNWVVGDVLGIATTDYNSDHSEKVTITQISHDQNGDVITFTPAIQYRHISDISDYGGKQLVMEGEVANLTRNVLFQGNPEDSIVPDYGAHIKAHGNAQEGTQVQITYIEMQYTGQPQILGRYSIHFHMIGNAYNSEIVGVANHDAFARLVALHSVHNLKIQNCIGYNTRAHNIFLEDGSETGNLIEGNLIISPYSAFNMLQTDITVAGIWITHPSNYVRYNHVAGSEFYGIWYEVKKRVGTSSDVCPMGSEVLEVAHNVGHSNTRFGLRFFKLQPRKYPCRDTREKDLADPFSVNPSVQYIYSNFTSYKNGESGVLAEYMGNSIFEDFVIADSYRTGFQVHVSNFTREDVIFRDSVVIGRTEINGEDIDYESTAIILPRTNGFLAQNIKVFNMQEGNFILESSSENQHIRLWTQGGYETKVENIQIFNSDLAGTIKWQGPLRNLVFDIDGSLDNSGKPTYITPYYPHFDQVIADGGCEIQETSSGYSNVQSVKCTTRLRGIKIGNLEKKSTFTGQAIKILNLNDPNKHFQTENEQQSDFSRIASMKIKNRPFFDCMDCYAAVVATDYVYNLHWNYGIDFSHLLYYPSYSSMPDDDTFILRFNYTENRELFDIYNMIGGELVENRNQITDFSKFIDSNSKPNSTPEGCNYGDFYHDQFDKLLYLCINDKQKSSKFQQIDVNGVYCRDTCPSAGFECEDKEDTQRYFLYSNEDQNQKQYVNQDSGRALRKLPGTSEWQYGIPQNGDDVLIPCEWSVLFNVQEFSFGTLIIDGTLRISEEFDNIKIQANNIWVRGGKIIAGNAGKPNRYSKNFTIELTGNKSSLPLIIDDISRTGTKSIAVTSRLELYGNYPEITHTRLTKTTNVGDTEIHVQDDIQDWNIGDQIILGSNHIDGTGFEKLTIQDIDYDNQIIFVEEQIQGWHYGNPLPTVSSHKNAEVEIDKSFDGVLDMRCTVGHITRNIKIVGSDEDGLGGHLQIYHYIEQDPSKGLDINSRGYAVLQGVEFDNMGQHASENAGLHILYTDIPVDDLKITEVEGSSFHDCQGICVNSKNSHGVSINNSVFYKGEKFLIQALDVKHWTITNNLFVGAIKQPGITDIGETYSWDPVAYIYMYTEYAPSTHFYNIQHNIGQGSEGIGYAFPGTPCDEKEDIQFKYNEAGYCQFVGVMYNMLDNMCYHVGYVSLYHNVYGTIINNKMNHDGIEVYNILAAENRLGILLHSASKNHIVHNNYVSNSWLSPLVRENCEDCYHWTKLNQNVHCFETLGIQLHEVTDLGESFPFNKPPGSYGVICTPPAVFGSSFFDNVEFFNVRDNYDTEIFENAGICKRNRAMKNDRQAASVSAGTYLTNTRCVGCEREGFVNITNPNPDWRSWFGGCGDYDCTGLENMIIQDMDGSFLGFEGTIISNNEAVAYGEGMKDDCEFIPAWNAFQCKNVDLGIIEISAEGEDKQEISPVPVYVSNDSWEKNKLNMWREWAWDGPEPLNQRHNRYVSYVHNHQWHNITYSGTQSVHIVHKLQQRSAAGDPDRNIVVMTNYGSPLALEVSVKDQIIPSLPTDLDANLNDHLSECGANTYFSHNNTVHFVLTNVQDCQVTVKQLNSIFLEIGIKITKEDFFNDEATQTNFIDRISAFLGISFDRVRIVGLVQSDRRFLQENSEFTTFRVAIVTRVPGRIENGYKASEDYLELTQLANQIIQGAQSGQLQEGLNVEIARNIEYDLKILKYAGIDGDKESDFYQEIDYIQEVEQNQKQKDNKINQNTKEKEEDSKIILIIIGIIFGIIGIIVVALLSYHIWKKKQLKRIHILQTGNKISIQDNSSDSNSEGKLDEKQQQVICQLDYDQKYSARQDDS